VPKTILIVDDDAGLTRVYRRILEKEGFTVVTAESAAGAWDILDRQSIDLCITDLAMPGVNGLDFLQKIRKDPRFHNLRVIVQSGFAEETQRAITAFHPLRIFQKPVSIDELLWTIRDSLGL